MSYLNDKQNFYIDRTLLKESNVTDNITETITKALKFAFDNSDDFAKFTRNMINGSESFSSNFSIENLVEDNQLKHNLLVREKGLQLFVQKNTHVKYENSILTIDKTKINLCENVTLKIISITNDFSIDNTCIEINFSEVEADV